MVALSDYLPEGLNVVIEAWDAPSPSSASSSQAPPVSILSALGASLRRVNHNRLKNKVPALLTSH